MKVAKRIDIEPINPSGKSNFSAIFVVDEENNVSGWRLKINYKGKTINIPASSGTILSLLMAERNFRSNTTEFYEYKDVDNG